MERNEAKAGDAVVFRWLGKELTGILISHPVRRDGREPEYVDIRTGKGRQFSLPWRDVLRKAGARG